MRWTLSEEKTVLIAPILIVILTFFIPISTSIKSICLVLTLVALLLTPYYRQYLFYAYNTLWARAAIVLFVYIIIASLWSEAPFERSMNVVDKYLKLLYLPLLAIGFINPKTRQWVLNSYLLVMLLTCFLSILKAKNLLILNTEDAGQVFYNHIVTGFMIALGVYFAGVLFFKDNVSRWQQFFYMFMIFLGSYQIFFINTGRTGYITYGSLMLLFLFRKLSFKKAMIGMLLFFAMISLIYIQSPALRDVTHKMINEIKMVQNNQQNNGLGFRIQFHQYAKSLFAEHPIIGIGTGGLSYRFAKDQPLPAWGKKLNEPHSQYWLILAEQGLIGIVLFLFFLGGLFLTSLKLKETKSFLLGVLVVFCLGAFSDTIFCYSTAGYLLILFSALCFGELIESHKTVEAS